jgi:hypothetical protein
MANEVRKQLRLTKIKLMNQQNLVKRQEEYNLNPTKCEWCKTLLPYKSRNNKFCSFKCSGNYSEKLRQDMRDRGICPTCNGSLKPSFCKIITDFFHKLFSKKRD